MPEWPAILEEHGPLVWRTAYRLLGNEPDASDCYQRTFLSAVEFCGEVANWPGLLRHLATTRALEQLRSRRRSVTRFAPMPETPPPDDRAIDPFEEAAGSELADRLRDALAEIEPLQAEVFCLICLDGQSYRGAADAMGITANHAGVLLLRARAALRDRMKAFDPNPVRD